MKRKGSDLKKKSPAKKPALKRERSFYAPKSSDTGHVDLALATYACDTTGSITLVATIPQGATDVSRVGKKAMYRSVQIRGRWTSNTACVVADAAAVLVYDRRPTGALPAITDILVAATAQAFNNSDNAGRFRIVRRWDKVFAGNSTTPTTGLEIQDADDFVKIIKPIVFKSVGSGAIADIEEGALYFVTVGSATAGTGAVSCTVAFRTTFNEV